MTIKALLADKRFSLKKSGGNRSKQKKKARADAGVLTVISEAARKATEEVIKRRKASEKEMARWRKAAKKEAARLAAEETDVEEAARLNTAKENTVGEDASISAVEEAAMEETAKLAAEEKAARKAAKKQKAAGETALWVAEAVKALGDNVDLNGEDAVTAAWKLCDSLEWKRLKNVTGCQIEYSLNEDFSDSRKEKIKRSHEFEKLEKKLDAGNKYYARVRLCSVVKDKKVCSDWSEVLTLKT